MEELLNLTGCKEVRVVRRGNKAIQYALRIAQALGKTKVLIQDQGGWITYEQYPVKMCMKLIYLKTDYGIIDKDDLFRSVDKDSVLLVNSMPGYHMLEDMERIEKICKDADCLVINDVSGSIGTDAAKYGDIVIGSFGADKPMGYGEGAFIGVKDPDHFDIVVIEEIAIDELLREKVSTLRSRLSRHKEIREKAIEDLKGFDIIHPDAHGINIIVRFSDLLEKERIINFCETNKFEFTLCPRYIRVETDAISIELKRLFKGDL